MLQNRVDPFGNIIKTGARGVWMGNRGLLHDHSKNLVRPFRLKAWITCVLEFKGRRRQVMAPDKYTELFFMDEATAFAAGHRPCFECRREDARLFKRYWLKGNPEYGFTEKTPIREIDEILHKERIDRNGKKVTIEMAATDIPDGTFILLNERPYLFYKHKLFEWSPSGYSKGIALPDATTLTVLTPVSVVNAFAAGYVPQIAKLKE